MGYEIVLFGVLAAVFVLFVSIGMIDGRSKLVIAIIAVASFGVGIGSQHLGISIEKTKAYVCGEVLK